MIWVREINIKNLFNDIISTKDLDLNNIKMDEKLYKKILIYYLDYVTLNSVKALYLIIDNANVYIKKVVKINIRL